MRAGKVAVVVAHADDAEIWAGGTLLNHRDAGDAIAIWYLYCPEEQRRQEAQTAAAVLGAAIRFPESDQDLGDQLAAFQPEILITHWELDSHPEHVLTAGRVGRVLPRLFLYAGVECRVFACDTYNSLARSGEVFTPSDVIDISEVRQRKCDLLAVYESQPMDYFRPMIERQERMHGARTGVEFAEAFRQVVVLGIMPRHRRWL